VPSEALKAILHDEDVRLLSLGAKGLAPMTGPVFKTAIIEPETYACQRKGEPKIQTIATRAVLVTTDDLPYDVEIITEAIFEGWDFLGVEGEAKDMATGLDSLPLHRDAKRYYQEVGALPSPPKIDLLKSAWYTLAILAILVGGYKSLLMLRRQRTSNQIGRRILAIPLEGDVRDSVERLLEIREEIQARVRRRWWQPGELDKPRWRYLYDLINDGIRQAKENLTRTLVAEIRTLTPQPELDETTGRQRYRSIERRVWEYFENGELDPSQRRMLLELLQERSQQSAEARESQTEEN